MSNISTIIFSVFQDSKTEKENQINTIQVASFLKTETDAIIIPTEGKYNGKKELGFLISNPSRRIMAVVGTFTRKFNQECILVIDKEHNAELLYSKTGKLERIGKLSFVDESELGNDDYTKLLLDQPMFLKVV